MNYTFGSMGASAPLTAKEKFKQFVTNPKTKVKGRKTSVEKGVNKTLAASHILTDDEYRFMSKKGAY